MTTTADAIDTLRANLPGLLSLALASTIAVTTEMVPVGLLPVIGGDFRVPDSVAGLLVSLYAVMVALLAVPLTVATARFARKPLLLATLIGYAMSNALVAAAPVFAVVAVGRAIGGLTHALFFSLLIGYTPRLVSRGGVGRALALVGGGASAGFILGAPLSTSLGTAAGWRAPFAVLAVASLLTVVLVIVLLPSVTNEQPATSHKPAGRGLLAAIAASNALTFLGQFTVYTFVSVLLLSSGASPALVGPILLGCGACGLVGLWWVGRRLDGQPRRTALAVLAVVVLALVALGMSWPSLIAVVVAMAVWNGAFGGVPSIYQATAVRVPAISPELAGAWINATANLGIAGGAAIGAGLLQSVGLSALPWVGAALAALGMSVILIARTAFPQRASLQP